MAVGKARTRSEDLEFFIYGCEPREQWPAWLQAAFQSIPGARAGDIATAAYQDGKLEWWRWFDASEFNRRFEIIV